MKVPSDEKALSSDGTTVTITVIEEDGETKIEASEFSRDAILFMMGAFMIEAVMWGLPSNFGVFQTYYTAHTSFQSSTFISTIGTLATGLPFLGAPLITPLATYFPKYRQQMIYIGWAICTLGLLGASFATEVWHLILAQGVIYGSGFLLLYYPLLGMLNEWFVKHRGLAYGAL